MGYTAEFQESIYTYINNFKKQSYFAPIKLVGFLMARQHRKVNLCQLRGRETGSVGKGWLTRYNAYYLTLHDNIVTQFIVKHCSYINAITTDLIERLTCVLLR